MRLKRSFWGGCAVLHDHLYGALHWKGELRYWEGKAEAVRESASRSQWCPAGTQGIGSPQDGVQRGIQESGTGLVLADLDCDGHLVPRGMPISNAAASTPSEFIARTRSELQLVDLDNYLGVRKSYRGDYWGFLNELRTLHTLALRGRAVPSIMAIDFSAPKLTVSYIPGVVLSELLARNGVPIRYGDRTAMNALPGRSRAARRAAAVRSARCVLHQAIGSAFVEEVRQEIQRLHANGIVWNDVNYSNIIVEQSSGRPYLIDFELSRSRQQMGALLFRRCCDRDMRAFEHLFRAPDESEER